MRPVLINAVAASTGGLAGILASGRAPAYAQGTTVHWLKWNDFVPAADEHLRKVSIPVAAGRNLAVLTEAAVRNYVLQLRGMDSTREFIERQSQPMEAVHDEDDRL